MKQRFFGSKQLGGEILNHPHLVKPDMTDGSLPDTFLAVSEKLTFECIFGFDFMQRKASAVQGHISSFFFAILNGFLERKSLIVEDNVGE